MNQPCLDLAEKPGNVFGVGFFYFYFLFFMLFILVAAKKLLKKIVSWNVVIVN